MGMKLFWGMVNLFSYCWFMLGVVINFDFEVFVFLVVMIKLCMDVMMQLGGENYVLWGGCEGYEMLLNIDMGCECQQVGCMLQMVVDYKYKIGFKGMILIELKLQELIKYQYDYDVVIVYGFFKDFGFEGEVKVNIE